MEGLKPQRQAGIGQQTPAVAESRAALCAGVCELCKDTTALCAITSPVLRTLCFLLTDSLPSLFNCFTQALQALAAAGLMTWGRRWSNALQPSQLPHPPVDNW